ncbi:MAG: endonuclease/exonuclease/phosphatase family protein [Flavobacteriaceae bacterium]|nr:endonuclease/exonuclease/phosphatase family protein [Flavobacteriaceae bacterium]
MNNTFKLILKLILVLLILLLGFYFWASSSNYNANEYSKTYENSYSSKINSDSIFSIITYNIGYLSGMTNNLPVEKDKSLFDANLSTVFTQFKKLNADIIAFQEIDFESKRSFDINQQNEIAKLGYNYVGQTINWDKKYLPFPEFPISMQYGRILSGQSILSKYKILEHERIELVRNPTNPFYYDAFYLDRLAQIAKIEIQDKTLIVINIHTEAFHQETRIKQTEKIIELFNQYSKEFPTILLGDFNSDISYENSSINLILNLQKTGCAAFEKDNFKNTFNTKDPSERLDYIFYNTDFIELIDGRVLTEFAQASDHLPVLMNFRFK